MPGPELWKGAVDLVLGTAAVVALFAIPFLVVRLALRAIFPRDYFDRDDRP